MKFPFTITAGGLDILFERVSCLEYYAYSPTAGISHDPVAHLSRACHDKMRWMGQGFEAMENSQRVGVCRAHLANDFTEATLTEWRESDFAKEHIAAIWERRRYRADIDDIHDETKPRPWEGISKDKDTRNEDGRRLYTVKVIGLTREDAINIYKMADSIRAERES